MSKFFAVIDLCGAFINTLSLANIVNGLLRLFYRFEVMFFTTKLVYVDGLYITSQLLINYLWGKPAEQIMRALYQFSNRQAEIRYVQIGTLASPTIDIPGALLKSTKFTFVRIWFWFTKCERISIINTASICISSPK
jgi:hypothetical protein